MSEPTANLQNMRRREFLAGAGLAAGCLCLTRKTRAGSDRSVVGEIAPADLGIQVASEDFDFVIFADPQGGDPAEKTNDAPERVAIHNPYILRNIQAVKRLEPQPAFLVVAGDIVDSKGQRANYDAMLDMLGDLEVPVLFELGNHETRYSARITPDDMSELENYFRAQKQINGLDKLLYSFDVGRWHFVVWPDPLRRGFWDAHPHFFDWLDRDLRKHADRPTIFIQHVPVLPIGIDPMIAYAESVPVKRRLLDILTRHGNVRYVFSGHTHIPLRASLKTARTYKGIQFINLPAAGYRARAFGEPDFGGTASQGFALVKVRGDQATVQFHRLEGETFTYPDEFPKFRPEDWPLWLSQPWELPAHKQFVNGGFEDGLKGWARRFVYVEDKDPSVVCEATEARNHSGEKSLYLFCRERGYHIRGQDRMPQTINRLSQAVTLEKGISPVLHFAFRPDGRHFDPQRDCGSYVWLEGYRDSEALLHMVYWIGKAIGSPTGLYGRRPSYVHWDITATPDEWHDVQIDVAGDHDRGPEGPSFDELDLDRMVLTLGVWTENAGKDQAIGVYFDDIRLAPQTVATERTSRVDGHAIERKLPIEIWNKRITHIDGEHVLVER